MLSGETAMGKYPEQAVQMMVKMCIRDRFEDLCKNLKNIYADRKADLKKQDRVREQDPEWYKKNDILGMMMYVLSLIHIWNDTFDTGACAHMRNASSLLRAKFTIVAALQKAIVIIAQKNL